MRPIWRPYTQEKIAPPPIAIDSAKGAHLYAKSGQKIFDGISSWWVINHGHCHPRITEAIQKQAERIDQVIFANFSHDPAEELAERLIRATPSHLTRVFFTDNGSTAVEAALKMTLQACQQKGQAQKKTFLSFTHAYHGDTSGAMSVSGRSLFTSPYKQMLFDIIYAKQPTHSSAPASAFVAPFKAIVEEQHESIAAIIIEPLLQGAGGMIVWPAAAIREIVALCRKYHIYVIFDEVMTGFGRTGSLFAMDQLGITPDLLCLSKGITGGSLPLAVTLVCDDIYDAFVSDDKSKMFFHGHSFTANPISCAAAVANFIIFDEEKTINHLARIQQIHQERLAKIDRKASLPLIDKRVCGTVAALEIETKQNLAGYSSLFAESLTQEAIKYDVFIRPLGNVVYLLPPYCATSQELEHAWDVLELAVTKALH